MDKTICGHERDVLIWALSWARDVWANDDTSLRELATMSWSAKNPTRYAVVNAIIDPAKLAEMLAHEGRRLGLSIAIYDNHLRFRMSGARVVYALLIIAGGFSIMDRDKRGWDFDVPQARHILLQWLQLPDGARKEAERGLRGEA